MTSDPSDESDGPGEYAAVSLGIRVVGVFLIVFFFLAERSGRWEK
jgi:hypothetical protein